MCERQHAGERVRAYLDDAHKVANDKLTSRQGDLAEVVVYLPRAAEVSEADVQVVAGRPRHGSHR